MPIGEILIPDESDGPDAAELVVLFPAHRIVRYVERPAERPVPMRRRTVTRANRLAFGSSLSSVACETPKVARLPPRLLRASTARIPVTVAAPPKTAVSAQKGHGNDGPPSLVGGRAPASAGAGE